MTEAKASMNAIVGFLITDRDAQCTPGVFAALENALSPIVAAGFSVDLVVSTRQSDVRARKAVQEHVPKNIRKFTILGAIVALKVASFPAHSLLPAQTRCTPPSSAGSTTPRTC